MSEQVIDLRFRSFHEEEVDGSHTVIVKISGLPSMAYANKASDWMRALIREHVDQLGSIDPNPPRVIEAMHKLDEAQRLLKALIDENKPDCGIAAAFLDCRLDDIAFGDDAISTRARNVFAHYSEYGQDESGERGLMPAPLVTVRDLVAKTKSELLRVPNMGRKTIERIEAVLAEHGMGLRK